MCYIWIKVQRWRRLCFYKSSSLWSLFVFHFWRPWPNFVKILIWRILINLVCIDRTFVTRWFIVRFCERIVRRSKNFAREWKFCTEKIRCLWQFYYCITWQNLIITQRVLHNTAWFNRDNGDWRTLELKFVLTWNQVKLCFVTLCTRKA